MPNPSMATCTRHEGHAHQHGPDCGHTAVQHEGHTDYLHDGHMHHIHGDHVDDHKLNSGGTNPERCTPEVNCGTHVHGPNCGHERVPHGNHEDYLVNGQLHHPHGNHCDNHGRLESAAA